MAKVYLLPDGFEAPIFNHENIPQYNKDCDELSEKLKKWCLERNPEQKNVGEIIRFQVADGYAEYMVAATKPVQLIHLPYWDSYQSDIAPFMTAKAIQDKIDQARAMEKLFSKQF